MQIHLSMRLVPAIVIALTTVVTGNTAETVIGAFAREPARERCWKEDLDYLARELPAKHLDFFKLIPKSKFEREIRKLEAELPQLADVEVVFGVMRLVASLGVSHTWADFPPRNAVFHDYPLTFYWFSDGLAVIGAAPDYRELIGARVIKIGSVTPRRAVAALAPYISHENDAWLYERSSALLTKSELLRHVGIARPDGRVRLAVIGRDGKSISTIVSPVDLASSTKWVWSWEVFNIPTSLSRKRGDAYWFEWLPQSQALYVQYSECRDIPGRPFADFAREFFAASESNHVRRIIVDLRLNGGGDSDIVKPLLNGLKARPHLTGKEHLYVLIGRKTVSSGLWAALRLQTEAGATLVGQPTGGKPNGYGNSPSMRLPNSQMEVKYSIGYYRLVQKADPPWLFPEIFVTASLQDFLAGRDPALEVALGQLPQ